MWVMAAILDSANQKTFLLKWNILLDITGLDYLSYYDLTMRREVTNGMSRSMFLRLSWEEDLPPNSTWHLFFSVSLSPAVTNHYIDLTHNRGTFN